MCFYVKGDRWGASDQVKETTHLRNDTNYGNNEWTLTSNELQRVKQIWSYKKDVLGGSVSSVDLKTLKPSNWLSDNVINAFLRAITAESSSISGSNYMPFRLTLTLSWKRDHGKIAYCGFLCLLIQ